MIMKKKLLKKIIGSCLSATLVIGALVGCGNTEPTTSEEPQSSATAESSTEISETPAEVEEAIEIAYPMDTDVTLTIAHITNGTVTANYEGLADTPFWSKWQELTGVKLESMELTKDAFNLLLVSGDLPDLVYCSVDNIPSGVEMAIEDKVIAPITKYMEYAPDLAAVVESDEIYRKGVTTTKGDIIGAPFIRGDKYLLTSGGMIIRADWLEELEMESPETPEELYNVLVAFKEEMGAETPLSVTSSDLVWSLVQNGLVTDGFGLPGAGLYQEDGEIHFGFAEPELKEVYTYLNKLYKEGLLDPEFLTIDNTVKKANIQSGRSGVTYGSVGGNLGTWMKEMWETDPEYELTGISPLVSAKGEVARLGGAGLQVTGDCLFMTTACENPEVAVQFMNYGYTEEGGMFFNYGIEGESYNMVDGYPTYTEEVMNNSEGKSMQQMLAGYCRSWLSGPFVQQKEYMEQFGSLERQKEALARWTNTELVNHVVPKIIIAEEDASEYNKIGSEVWTYVKEMCIAYVTGAKSLDTFETEYLATMKSLGIDRWIEIQQAALDVYNAK